MINNPLNRRFVVALGAALLLATPALRAETAAQDQAAIQPFIVPATKNIVTASSTAIATAVAEAIASVSGTNPNVNGLTPAGLASSVFEPVVSDANKLRADRNTTGSLVVAKAIAQLNLQSDVNFNSDVASLVDAVVNVNNPTPVAVAPKTAMTVKGQGTTIKGAVAELALLGNTVGTASTLTAIHTLTATLSTDPKLLALQKNGIATVLETGLTGVVTFPKGTVGVSGPVAAQNFAMGLSGTSAAPASLVTILKGVAKNTRVDNFFSYGIGTTGTTQVAIGQALLKAYVADTAQITQGLAASITSGTGEPARATFAQTLALGTSKTNTIGILQGMAYVDPYYTHTFTNAVFSALVGNVSSTTLNSKLVVTDAPKIATALGQILGSDGNELTNVAATFANFIVNGPLPASSAGTYVTNLINGAVTSKIVAFAGDQGYGGKLGGVSPITATSTNVAFNVVQDLASIADQMVAAVVAKDASLLTTAKGVKTVAALVAKITADVAKFVKNASFTDPNPNDSATPTSIAAYIAGTVANVLATADPTNLAAYKTAIINSVKALTNSTFDSQVIAKVGTNNDGTVGAIASQETPITNL